MSSASASRRDLGSGAGAEPAKLARPNQGERDRMAPPTAIATRPEWERKEFRNGCRRQFDLRGARPPWGGAWRELKGYREQPQEQAEERTAEEDRWGRQERRQSPPRSRRTREEELWERTSERRRHLREGVEAEGEVEGPNWNQDRVRARSGERRSMALARYRLSSAG